MICPECNGRGETTYYVETDRDENTVTVKARKDICHTCNGSGEKPMTNADRIRAMSDEELARLLLDGCRGSKCDEQPQNEYGSVNCYACRLQWLQQPAETEPTKEG